MIVIAGKAEGITFDSIYTGYLGTIEQVDQIDQIKELFRNFRVQKHPDNHQSRDSGQRKAVPRL